MVKAIAIGLTMLFFVGVVGYVNAQTTTPTPSPTTTVPSGAPSTGFGK